MTTARTEECTGEVQPLLDVGGDGCSLQGPPHLLGYAHEPVREDAQLDRVQARVQTCRILRSRFFFVLVIWYHMRPSGWCGIARLAIAYSTLYLMRTEQHTFPLFTNRQAARPN